MIRFITMKDATDTHLSEVKSALETYAKDYFSSFVLSDDGFTLDCYDGDDKILSFNMTTGRKNFKITSYGNNCNKAIALASGNTATTMLYRMYITTNGIAISFKVINAFKPTGLYITKSDKGNTSVIIAEKVITGGTTASYGLAYTKNSTDIIDIPYVTGLTSSRSFDMTTIVPIVCSATDEYCPNVYAVLQSQYCGTEGALTIDGINYWYNGAFALKDE